MLPSSPPTTCDSTSTVILRRFRVHRDDDAVPVAHRDRARELGTQGWLGRAAGAVNSPRAGKDACPALADRVGPLFHARRQRVREGDLAAGGQRDRWPRRRRSRAAEYFGTPNSNTSREGRSSSR